jgi:hypothetical protein
MSNAFTSTPTHVGRSRRPGAGFVALDRLPNPELTAVRFVQ